MPPLWYILIVSGVFAALVYFCMIRWHIQLSNGIPLDPNLFQVTNMGEKAPGIMPYVLEWNAFNIAGLLICLVLGSICLILGVIRALNKLSCKHIFLIALFSLLFSIDKLSVSDFALRTLSAEFLFYVTRVTYIFYPIALFTHLYYYLRHSARKWMSPLIIMLVVYAVASWVMYLGFGLPLSVPNMFYTYVSAACSVIFLGVGSFAAESKAAARYIRTISAAWICWLVYMVVKSAAGIQTVWANEYMVAITVSVAFMLSYVLLVNTLELENYKTEARLLELRNGLLVENYQTLEAYMSQIAQMKHEMRHHLLAMKILTDDGKHEQLAAYLTDIQDSYTEAPEIVICGHRMIQSVLGHAAQRAGQMGFEISFDISPLPPLTITDTDTVSLLMNLINNALESCEKMQSPKKRWITVATKPRAPYLYISVKNSSGGDVRVKNGRYISTKEDPFFHGHGLTVVHGIAKKYNGFAEFEHTEDSFCAEVALRVI